MGITVITSARQHQRYLAKANRLIRIDPSPRSKQGKLLALLALVIEAYERERFVFDKPTPLEAILFRMEQQGLRQQDLVPYLGSRSRASEILSGKRKLSLAMIRKLSQGLDIPVSALI